MKTNLFIAGACKSGTTYLHDFLSQQESVFGANPKEPYFFELPETLRNENLYHSKYFKAYDNQQYQLDSRHRTMFFSWMPKTIYNYNAQAKLIFILRNPVERAHSHWWMWYSRNIIKTSFFKSICNEIKSIEKNGRFMDISPDDYHTFIKEKSHDRRLAYADAHTIVESGYYYEQIKKFQDYFNSDQLLILDFETLSNTTELSGVLQHFLNVKMSSLKTNKKKNKARDYKKTQFFLASYIPKGIKLKLKDLFFKQTKMNIKEKIMLQQHYKDHNDNLVSELGLDFVKKWEVN